MSEDYALHVHRVHDVVWGSKFFSKVPDLYLKVRFGDTHRRTRVVKRNISPHWNETLTFSSEASTNINIQIRHASNWSPDPCLGYIDITLADLLKKCAEGDAQLILRPPHGKGTTSCAGILHLRLEVSTLTKNTEENVKAVAQALDQSGFLSAGGATDSTNVEIFCHAIEQSKQDDLYRSLGSLIAKLDVLIEVINKFSKIHPYLNAAWQITSALYMFVSKQFRTDKEIVDLVNSMEKAFEFVRDSQSLPNKIQSLEKTIIELLKQLTECCLFVRQYLNRKFTGRLLGIDDNKKIGEFNQSLTNLREALIMGNVIYTAFVSARTESKIENLTLRQALNPIQTNAFGRPTCLPGTRVDIQKEIVSWLLSDSSQNILWLSGVTGSGKSTISTTMAEYFREISRLGAFLLFERGKSDPSSVIPTIAYALASLDPAVAARITAAVEQDSSVATASAKVQFDKLLLGPLTPAADTSHGPVIIILDALDECGTPQSRQDLMRLLKEEFPKLPSCFRFLITSRPEIDIMAALSSQPNLVHSMELDYTSDTSRNDVLSYIKCEMYKAVREVEIPKDWPWDINMERLGFAAGGLFVWASTAVKLVSSSDNPFRRLKELVLDSPSLARLGLSELYATVLRSSGIDWSNHDSKARFAQVISVLLFSKVPLSSEAIDGILGFPPEEPSRLVISRLRCLLSYTPEQPVSLFHTSFSDYLLSPERIKDPWHIDVPSQKHFIASRCFDIMENMLHFNMCDIESSFVPNDDIVGLDARIKSKIPPHLEYACLFWAQHLCEVPQSPDLIDNVLAFAYTRLLFWFEALSLINQFVGSAIQALVTASSWTTSEIEIQSFLKDAARLGAIFSPCIVTSTPHIYVSMLPLMRNESIVAAHYSKHMCSMVEIEQRGTKAPSILVKVLQGYGTEYVYSVNFSPDGKWVVSGSSDGAIRVWDVETGLIVLGPLVGHTDCITSVNFSPDGKQIVSGSDDKTIRVWDTKSGDGIGGPFEGHTDRVISVNYSPDGKQIVSGSADNTVRVWDAESWKGVLHIHEGHRDMVRSVNFSPDGIHIVSGSNDRTIRVWSAEAEVLVLDNQEHGLVTCVIFSPDGKRIVSGSIDGTIRIWCVESGEVILSPLAGHKDAVTSVNLSSDGKRVISGSGDKTIIVWDGESGAIILGPLEGHKLEVNSVDFSPDGKHILSGSADKTIRIWDAESTLISRSIDGYLFDVLSANFSPCGKYIVSGSMDGPIRYWNAMTGESVKGAAKRHLCPLASVYISPFGKQFALGSYDGEIITYNSNSGVTVLGPLEHNSCVRSVGLSPNGVQLVSAYDNGTIATWNVDSGTLTFILTGHTAAVWSVNFSPDGNHIVSGSNDKTIRIWDAKTGAGIRGPFEGHMYEVASVNFSPDGKLIVSGSHDGTVKVWDVETGACVLDIKGHRHYVSSVNFSVNGKCIVSGSYDGAIIIWNSETGLALLDPLEGHTDVVNSVNFSPDGKRIVSASNDKTIRIWNVVGHEDDWVLANDGWIVSAEGDLLFWVPYDLHLTLWRPRNTAVFGCKFSTKLNFDHAALGERWGDCYKPIE